MNEISKPNYYAPHGDSGNIVMMPPPPKQAKLEQYITPLLIPLLSSIIGAAASYTAIRKDIVLNQERVTKLESNRVILEKRINDFQTKIAVIEVKISAITNKRTR